MEKLEKSMPANAGFVLEFLSNKEVYLIQSNKYGTFEGSLVSVWQKMSWEFDIPNAEISLALCEMNKNNHNVSHFGILGTFMFTSEK